MGAHAEVVFVNCGCTVEEIRNPQTNEVGGRAFVITDQDNDTIYRFPMNLDVAKKQGQRLMGIGTLDVVQGNGAAAKRVRKR